MTPVLAVDTHYPGPGPNTVKITILLHPHQHHSVIRVNLEKWKLRQTNQRKPRMIGWGDLF